VASGLKHEQINLKRFFFFFLLSFVVFICN
jgi:hypothetical protein